MRKLTIIGCLLISLSLGAQDGSRREGQSLLFQPKEEYKTSAEVGYRFREQNEALVPQLGRGLSQGEFRARSRHDLDSLTRIEGKVSYERGYRMGVNYNSGSDWLMLFPYITVDTVGGDLQKEQYRFYARYATRKSQFFYSAAFSYRALQEWRQVDPRPRNISADLQAYAMAGLVKGEYALSLEASYRLYHQYNSVSFYDPLGNNSSVLHSLGFDRYNTRFSGAVSSTSIRFKGRGFGLQARLEPVSGLGWIAGADYRLLVIDRHLPTYNETPISRLTQHRWTAWAGKKWSQGFLRADVFFRYKLGYENIVDETGAYRTPGSLKMYEEPVVGVFVKGMRQWQGEKAVWTLRPGAAWIFYQGRSLYDGQAETFRFAALQVEGDAAFPVGNWDFRVGGGLGAGLDGWYRMALGGLFERPLTKDLQLYLRPSAEMMFYKKNYTQAATLLTIGIKF